MGHHSASQAAALEFGQDRVVVEVMVLPNQASVGCRDEASLKFYPPKLLVGRKSRMLQKPGEVGFGPRGRIDAPAQKARRNRPGENIEQLAQLRAIERTDLQRSSWSCVHQSSAPIYRARCVDNRLLPVQARMIVQTKTKLKNIKQTCDSMLYSSGEANIDSAGNHRSRHSVAPLVESCPASCCFSRSASGRFFSCCDKRCTLPALAASYPLALRRARVAAGAAQAGIAVGAAYPRGLVRR